MTDPTGAEEETLLERIDAIERDNSRLRRLSIALIGLVAVLTGLAVAIMVVSARYGLPGTTADIVATKQLVIRDRMKVTMSCDHRIIDGATGAEYLKTLRQYIEQPLRTVI